MNPVSELLKLQILVIIGSGSFKPLQTNNFQESCYKIEKNQLLAFLKVTRQNMTKQPKNYKAAAIPVYITFDAES